MNPMKVVKHMNNLLIIILIICVLISGFFSCIELALAKVNKAKIERHAQQNVYSAKLASHFINHYNDTIITILVGNNLANNAASAIATVLFVALNPTNGEFLATIVMAIVILTFGEVLPKAIASSYSYQIATMFSYPMKFFDFIFKPFKWIVNAILKGFNKLLSKSKKKNTVTDDELIEMVDTLEEQGLIDEDAQELITNAIDFIDVDAVEVMIHRMDVFAFDIQDDINELLNNPNLLNYSRIPVYDRNIDNILGILNTKQLIKHHLNGDEINISELLTEPLYVFQTQAVSSVLKNLRQQHIHMAIVKDEFGGTLGIVTLEDVIEELVGEIYDEKDITEKEEYHKVNEKKFTVDGDMNIYDFFDIIEYNYDHFESFYTTVGGWITDQLEKFPEEKDSFDFEGYHIVVMRASEFKVERVSVTKIKEDSIE